MTGAYGCVHLKPSGFCRRTAIRYADSIRDDVSVGYRRSALLRLFEWVFEVQIREGRRLKVCLGG